MNKSRLNFRPLPWLMAPVPSIFLVACGGGGQDTILGTGGMAPVASSAPKVTLSAGIPASKMNVKGVNGAAPVTKPGECVGTKVTPALISCLQPDRRVDIEVTGQR